MAAETMLRTFRVRGSLADQPPLIVLADPLCWFRIEVFDATTSEAVRADVEVKRIGEEFETSDGTAEENRTGFAICGGKASYRQTEFFADEIVRQVQILVEYRLLAPGTPTRDRL